MADVLLIHGFLNTPDLYEPLHQALARDWDVDLPIAPGHSEALGHPFRFEEWLRSLVARLDEETDAALIGHSAGGYVAMLAAAARPDIVRGVVTLDSPPLTRRDLMSGDEVDTYISDLLTSRPHLRDVVFHISNNDLDSIFDGFPEDLLAVDFRLPVLMIGADPRCGAMLTPELVEAARRSWSDVRAARIEGTNHMLGIDDGDVSKVMEHVTPFLSEVLDTP